MKEKNIELHKKYYIKRILNVNGSVKAGQEFTPVKIKRKNSNKPTRYYNKEGDWTTANCISKEPFTQKIIKEQREG